MMPRWSTIRQFSRTNTPTSYVTLLPRARSARAVFLGRHDFSTALACGSGRCRFPYSRGIARYSSRLVCPPSFPVPRLLALLGILGLGNYHIGIPGCSTLPAMFTTSLSSLLHLFTLQQLKLDLDDQSLFLRA